MLCVLGLSIAVPVSAQVSVTKNCVNLSRNLYVGIRGEDVRTLQQVLNANVQTRVALSGDGAPGLETTYFGLKTKNAVMRFQELYRNEVLTPAGLVSGSGFVGIFSRAKLSALCMVAVAPVSLPLATTTATTTLVTTPTKIVATTTATSSQSLSTMTNLDYGIFSTDKLVFMFPSFYSAIPGKTIAIYGGGFKGEQNVVHLDSYAIANTFFDKMGTLSFVVPSDVPRGKHAIWISNSKGETNKSFFIVTDPKIPAPKITDFTPKEGPLGTIVIVTGEGFTPQTNEVAGGDGLQQGIASSDGKTLKFPVTVNIPGVSFTSADLPADMRVPVWYYVRNENGLTSTITFTVTP